MMIQAPQIDHVEGPQLHKKYTSRELVDLWLHGTRSVLQDRISFVIQKLSKRVGARSWGESFEGAAFWSDNKYEWQ